MAVLLADWVKELFGIEISANQISVNFLKTIDNELQN